MTTPWFLFAALTTAAIVTATEMALFLACGPTAGLIGLPISVCFFLLSVWFTQLWEYAATSPARAGS